MSGRPQPGDPDFPYMLADTSEEFERVRRAAWPTPSPTAAGLPLEDVERVARVLFDADGWPPGWWDNDHKDLCDRFRRLARAALAGESVTHRGEAVPVATLATIAAEVEARVQAAEDRHVGIVREATDLCWKATPYTQDEEGFVAAYLLPAGVVHRLLGALQGAGYSAAFRAIAAPLAGQHTTDEETDRG